MIFLLLLSAVVIPFASASLQFPRATFPISRRFNLTSGTIAEHDRARAALLKAQRATSEKRSISIAAINEAVSYTANIGIGTPVKTFALIVDIGTSITEVGGYKITSTGHDTGCKVSSESPQPVSGELFTDIFTLGATKVTQGFVGSASSIGLTGADGILGLGPNPGSVTCNSVVLTESVPTLTHNLFADGLTPEDLLGVSFEPTTVSSVSNGELTFGGTDSSKFTGTITFSPVTTTSPADEFWGINLSAKYGTTALIAQTAGIVDTGTTLILIPSNAFTKYLSLTGGVLDNTTGLVKITAAQLAALKSIFITFGGTAFELTANAQLWPRSLNTLIGGTTNGIYLIVNSIGTPSGEGLDFILGYAFLERFYSVYDNTNKRVGFANTAFTNATTN